MPRTFTTIDVNFGGARVFRDSFNESDHPREGGKFASKGSGGGGGKHPDHEHMKAAVHKAAEELGADAGHSAEKIAENKSKADSIASDIAGKKTSATKLEDKHNISSGLAKRIAEKHKEHYAGQGSSRSAGGQAGQAARVSRYLRENNVRSRR